jgi:hypothetical protein
MESREWKIRLGMKTFKIRTQIERILNITLIIKDLGTQATSVDPVHAELPVAGLYLILSVCIFRPWISLSLTETKNRFLNSLQREL